jgi:AcrR family transcriptional regulator
LGQGPGSRGEQSRARILEAGRNALQEVGLEGFVLRGIAERAGMGLGNLQYYFPTRDDLLAAVIRDEYERNLSHLVYYERQDGDLATYLERISELLIRAYTGSGGGIWAVLSLLRLHNSRFRRLSEEIYQGHYDSLVDAMRSFGVAGSSAELREKARLITAVLDGATLQAHAGPHSRDSEAWRAFCEKIGEIVVAVAKR